MAKSNVLEISAVLEELKAQMAALAARIEKLEEGAAVQAAAPAPVPAVEAAPEAVVEAPEAIDMPVNGKASPAPAPQAEVPPAEEEGISEEVLIVISAAVAAFLGERAHIRQVRLIRTGAWAQEGRVSIQASHRLH
jgi:methylmalonyl-CoA carboxyltransferase 12S subunit